MTNTSLDSQEHSQSTTRANQSASEEKKGWIGDKTSSFVLSIFAIIVAFSIPYLLYSVFFQDQIGFGIGIIVSVLLAFAIFVALSTFSDYFKSDKMWNAFIGAILFYFIFGIVHWFIEPSPETQLIYEKPRQETKQEETRVVFTQSGLFPFELKAWEDNGQWLFVGEGLRYSISTPPGQPFLIKYQNGTNIEIRGDNVKIPDRAGNFKIQALEVPVSAQLLVSKHR
jgi:energy-coupling factor transporter transmembrane protein EcfT